MEKFKKFLGPFLFVTSALLLFFFAAFLVVVFRTKSSQYVNMPDLTGRTYLEVHNEIARLRLKVKIEEEKFPDKIDGLILQQSIPAGKPVEVGSKLTLTVNTGINKIIVPKLIGLHLDNAKGKLQKVLSGETYIDLELGGVTYVPAKENTPPDTVIEQIPEPGKVTTSKEKIYLLVTEPDAKKNSSMNNYKEKYVGSSFPLVIKGLNLEKKKWKLVEVIPTKDRRESSIIESFEQKAGVYEFKVKYFSSERRSESGYELIQYSPKDSEEIKVEMEVLFRKKATSNVDDLISTTTQKVEDSATNKAPEKQIEMLMEPTQYAKDEKLNLIVYRVGNIKVNIVDSAGKVKQSTTLKSEL